MDVVREELFAVEEARSQLRRARADKLAQQLAERHRAAEVHLEGAREAAAACRWADGLSELQAAEAAIAALGARARPAIREGLRSAGDAVDAALLRAGGALIGVTLTQGPAAAADAGAGAGADAGEGAGAGATTINKVHVHVHQPSWCLQQYLAVLVARNLVQPAVTAIAGGLRTALVRLLQQVTAAHAAALATLSCDTSSAGSASDVTLEVQDAGAASAGAGACAASVAAGLTAVSAALQRLKVPHSGSICGDVGTAVWMGDVQQGGVGAAAVAGATGATRLCLHASASSTSTSASPAGYEAYCQWKATVLAPLLAAEGSWVESGCLHTDSSSLLPFRSLSDQSEAVFAAELDRHLLLQTQRICAGDFSQSVQLQAEPHVSPAADALPPGGHVDFESLVLRLPTMAVTAVAQQLAGLVKATAAQASNAAAHGAQQLAATLARTCASMLDLYLAVVPFRSASLLASVPRYAFLLHNDCVLLSRAAVDASALCSHTLPSHASLLIGKVSELRTLGQRSLLGAVAAARSELQAALRQQQPFGGALADTHDDREHEAAVHDGHGSSEDEEGEGDAGGVRTRVLRAARGQTALIRLLAGQAREVLPPLLASTITAHLLDLCLRDSCVQLLESRAVQISATACGHIAAYFEEQLSLQQLLQQQQLGPSPERLVRHLQRARLLHSIMRDPLSSTVAYLRAHTAAVGGIVAREDLRSLLRAVFEDSHQLREALRLLQD